MDNASASILVRAAVSVPVTFTPRLTPEVKKLVIVKFPPPSLKNKAPSLTGPTTEIFDNVVVVTGVASPLSPLLEPSIPAFAPLAIYQKLPLPTQPSAKSIESSPLPMDTK